MAPGTRAHVLIVEDRPEIARLYESWLSEDYDVSVSHDGDDAVDTFDQSVDVVVLDRRLPGRPGDEVLQAIRDVSDCSVAMATAVEPDFDILEMGFDEYVVKPLTRGELIGTIERLLARDNYADSLQRYFALVAKRSVLEEHKSSAELDDDRYREFSEQIDDLEADLEHCVDRFEHRDFEALFRSLDDTEEADPILE
ncbi:response regulator with CheY-like receiver, AAA-type ATPase, and DNA-binding domains [Salinarchaeum sp. Harcht-Bsk1]|uniref:HalX domain-containing protein n=1 Tax=Salinarchaeum sp. Harcht-Bsk1 TaxID=1333523 RepID=UPI0003424806|nr:HalX domain-containing protein [Salinarchaeum sp. Harcht-Bsk1]AGN01260.1 response regulator with CheY-like receiver, AAA-type ATPase, and DNA-binding domains [Salinarchaeum sp. Harcht-Bsk1]